MGPRLLRHSLLNALHVAWTSGWCWFHVRYRSRADMHRGGCRHPVPCTMGPCGDNRLDTQDCFAVYMNFADEVTLRRSTGLALRYAVAPFQAMLGWRPMAILRDCAPPYGSLGHGDLPASRRAWSTAVNFLYAARRMILPRFSCSHPATPSGGPRGRRYWGSGSDPSFSFFPSAQRTTPAGGRSPPSRRGTPPSHALAASREFSSHAFP